ncbi:MAG: ATP-binding protein [Deltaproteobacteria bacterium]|nr:ATP-binding protein [Deltaproteobacteria bacterium]
MSEAPSAFGSEGATGDFEALPIEKSRASIDPTPSVPLYRADPDRILRVLASNQFEDPYLAFRELYANALDAVRGRPSAKVDIKVFADRVVIEDDGPGLDERGLLALTTLGASTRRGTDAIGRFGIGFASIFDPALGVSRVEFLAARPGLEQGVLVTFLPDDGGGVAIEVIDVPPFGGSRVSTFFDAARALEDRVERVIETFEQHAAYTGVATSLNGKLLGRDLSDYIKAEVKKGAYTVTERALVSASAVRGPVGVAAVDPTRSESKFRAYQRGLFVTEIALPKVLGRPWPRGAFGAVHADGLDLVASRNAFIENEAYARFLEEINRLAFEAAYRVVRYFEAHDDPYARVVLLDAIRRGLKTATPEGLLAESSDLFSSAVVRSEIFRAWNETKRYSFEELVAMKVQDRFRALSYRPAGWDIARGPVLRADDSIERDIFRKLSGMRDMPAVARAENVSLPSFVSRALDKLLSGPRAEYSLFQHDLDQSQVPAAIRRVVLALSKFLASEEVVVALGRLLPGQLPRLAFGASRNAFGPVAAYRLGEIRFNVRHRTLRRLARHPDPELAARALLPVLAHELAHVCHELHDLDFYRTSRALLRALAVAAAKIDAQRFGGPRPLVPRDITPVSRRPSKS